MYSMTNWIVDRNKYNLKHKYQKTDDYLKKILHRFDHYVPSNSPNKVKMPDKLFEISNRKFCDESKVSVRYSEDIQIARKHRGNFIYVHSAPDEE